MSTLSLTTDRFNANPGWQRNRADQQWLPYFAGLSRGGAVKDVFTRSPRFAGNAPVELEFPDIIQHRSKLALYHATVRARQQLRPFVDALSLSSHAAAEDCVTPLDESTKRPNLFYKREDLTAVKAYKVRGAMTAMLRAMEGGKRRFVAASTGNHALGVLKAAELLRPESVRVVVPENVSGAKWEKLSKETARLRREGLDAELVRSGKTFDEARRNAKDLVGGDELYIDPYAHPDVVAGQGTLGLELVDQLWEKLADPSVRELVVVAPVGGGGLLAGAATAVSEAVKNNPALRHVTPRFVGVRLSDTNAVLGDAIRVEKVHGANLERLDALNVDLRNVLDDDGMRKAQALVKKDLGASVEGASAGALLPVLEDADFRPSPERLVVCVLSGGNTGE